MTGTGAAGLVVAAVMAAVATGASDSRRDDPSIEGLWRTPAGGQVEIAPCGEAYCGRLVDAPALEDEPDLRDVNNRDPERRSRPLRGVEILEGFEGGPDTWTGGPLYDPESGREAGRGRLTLEGPDRLSVRGCIGPLLCRTQTWTRER